MVVPILIFWNFHTVFCNGCTHLYSHQQYPSLPFSPHPCHYILFLVFLISRHSKSREVMSHCSDLHFPDDYWCWAPFYIPAGQLSIFFGKRCFFLFLKRDDWLEAIQEGSLNSLLLSKLWQSSGKVMSVTYTFSENVVSAICHWVRTANFPVLLHLNKSWMHLSESTEL